MAPYYNFVRSFETYSLPQDEKNGMIKMYGRLTGMLTLFSCNAKFNNVI